MQQDALSILTKGLVQLGAVALDAKSPLPPGFNVVPVDHAALAISQLVQQAWPEARVIHLCSPKTLTMSKICEWIRSAGHVLEEVSAERFCALVQEVLLLDRKTRPVWTFEDGMAGQEKSGVNKYKL